VRFTLLVVIISESLKNSFGRREGRQFEDNEVTSERTALR
jgi:hypothetical protein